MWSVNGIDLACKADMMKDRTRKTFYGSMRVAQPPEVVFEFLRSIENLHCWSSCKQIRQIEGNLYQADESGCSCRFFWIVDPARRRVIQQHTENTDSPSLVISISGVNCSTQIEFQYSSFTITARQRRQLASEISAIQQLLGQAELLHTRNEHIAE